MASTPIVNDENNSEPEVVTTNSRESGQKRKSVFAKLKSRVVKICRLLCRCCGRNRHRRKEEDGQTVPQINVSEDWNKLQNTDLEPKQLIAQEIPLQTRVRAQNLFKKLESEQIILGKYIGSGSYGFVLEATYKNKKKVAVKIVDMTERNVKFSEIDLMKRLRHKNIIRLVTGFI